MRSLIAALVFSSAVLAAQDNKAQADKANIAMSTTHVNQGQPITFNLTFNRPPTVPAAVRVTFSSQDNKEWSAVGGVGPDSKTASAGTTMPVDATVGTWKVTAITIAPTSTVSTPPKTLKLTGTTIFQVVKSEEIILPDSADVSISK